MRLGHTAIVLAFVATLIGISFAAAPAQDDATPDDKLRKIRIQKLQAAKIVLESFNRRQEVGAQLTEVFMTQKAVWCRRVMEAELQLAESRRERVEAANRYHKQMSQLVGIARRRGGFDQSPSGMAEAEYRLHEAEEILLLEKTPD